MINDTERESTYAFLSFHMVKIRVLGKPEVATKQLLIIVYTQKKILLYLLRDLLSCSWECQEGSQRWLEGKEVRGSAKVMGEGRRGGRVRKKAESMQSSKPPTLSDITCKRFLRKIGRMVIGRLGRKAEGVRKVKKEGRGSG